MKRMNLLAALLIALLFLVPVTTSFATIQKATQAENLETLAEHKIDVNTAGRDKLIQLPGIGPKKAEAIEKYLKDNGNLKSIEELLNVKGIGPKLLEKITPYVTI